MTDLSNMQQTMALPSVRLSLGTYTAPMPSRAPSLIPRSTIILGEEQEVKHRGAKWRWKGLNLALPNPKLALSPSNYPSSLGFLAEVL